MRESIQTHYHQGWRAKEKYSAAAYEQDLNAHLYTRLESDRRFVIPWLNSARPLNGMRVLEIGCGTGSSSVALAEQGAQVTGIDIDGAALEVARESLPHPWAKRRYQRIERQTPARFRRDGRRSLLRSARTHDQRGAAAIARRGVGVLLSRGGLLAIIETPNRLWFLDQHTSQLPFYNWLPHDLAFAYSRFSPRENFKDTYRELNPESLNHFLRRGRGASYHEIDVAIAPTQSLDTVNASLAEPFLAGVDGCARPALRDATRPSYAKSVRIYMRAGSTWTWMSSFVSTEAARSKQPHFAAEDLGLPPLSNRVAHDV